jgi:uncharacterized membrane protein
MGAALVVLAAVVAALGPALTLIPISALRLVVGALLAIFGLMWLRKAILRATGHKALHDEASAYLREVAAAERAERHSRRGVNDWYAFTLSFKGVLLEGLEVVFIVLTFGINQGSIWLAALGAVAAVVVITAIGIAARSPLARVPENTMKFAVGIMLTSFGTFWGAEGAGVHWPGSDAALLGLIPAFLLVSLAYTALLRRAGSGPADGGAAGAVDAPAAAEAPSAEAAAADAPADAPAVGGSAAEPARPAAEPARPSGKTVS